MALQDGGPEIEQMYNDLCDTIDRAKSIPTSFATPAEALLQVNHTSCTKISRRVAVRRTKNVRMCPTRHQDNRRLCFDEPDPRTDDSSNHGIPLFARRVGRY